MSNTLMAASSSSTRPPLVQTTSNASSSSGHPLHFEERYFLGPIPEKVFIAHQKVEEDEAVDSEDRDSARAIIKDVALAWFVREGGDVADWEREQKSVREEMLRRWRASDWGKTVAARRGKGKELPTNDRWVGNTFQVGNLLGLNIFQDSITRVSTRSSHSRSLSSPRTEIPPRPSLATTQGSYATAHTELGDAQILSAPNGITAPESFTSQTPLIERMPSRDSYFSRARTEAPRRPVPILQLPSTAISDTVAMNTKQKKTVHYADPATQPPALPQEVLQRTGDAVEATSAGAMADVASVGTENIDWGDDVVMRDRMLVRINYTKFENLRQFDEHTNKTTSDLRYEDWGEYMVVWRNDRIELYEDYTFPGKERVLGHKHLAFVISLKSTQTKVSLYSFVDLTFSVLSPPFSTHKLLKRSRLGLPEKEGLNIFVFKVRTRSRAYDWLYQLWRHTGGELPDFLEVWNPALDVKVKIDIPFLDTVDTYQITSRENILSLCTETMRSIEDYKTIIENQVEQGKVLELAWRMGSSLDWIWLEDDINGKKRRWEVLCGLATKLTTVPCQLELRLGDHFPRHLRLRDGTKLIEPPAIEGYLDRIRPNTQTKQQVYLTTHNGYLFRVNPAHANPPIPVGLSSREAVHMRECEVKRGAHQIRHATGVFDLRCIVAVRRAFQQVIPQHHKETASEADRVTGSHIEDAFVETSDSDHEDEGGEEAINNSNDKPHMRMRRSFELLLDSGRVVRLEAYSRKVAIEWIERLRALVTYWKQRHRIDAVQEMEIAEARRPRVTPHIHIHEDDEDLPPVEPEGLATSALPALGSIYNWCVIEGCKAIVRGGTVFMRNGNLGQFKMVQLVLISGTLLSYRVTPGSSMHKANKKKYSLTDSFVTSGYFAMQAFPRDRYNSPEVLPRRYKDGLEVDDLEQDKVFVIFYRTRKDLAPGVIPPLSAEKKMVTFKTRSVLERDAWCWALNTEIEKITREQQERETKLRESGQLPIV